MLRRKTKGRHWAKLVDERLVKGLRTQYNQFYTERYKSGDYKGMNVGEAGKLIGAEWRALSASEKKVSFCQVSPERGLCANILCSRMLNGRRRTWHGISKKSRPSTTEMWPMQQPRPPESSLSIVRPGLQQRVDLRKREHPPLVG